MAKFNVRVSYSLEIEAKNEEEAKELFLDQVEALDSNWIADCTEVNLAEEAVRSDN
jgi:hypothetical protein